MNIKNNIGVTLTILVVTIVVMLILFGVTFSTATDLLKNSQKNKMKTMLYMVQSRAEILLDDYLFDNDGKDLSTISDSDIQKALGGTYMRSLTDIQSVGFGTTFTELPSKDTIIYCSWNESVLKSQGIDTKNLANGDTIVIQYNVATDEVDVASKKGFSDGDGNAIHALSDF